MPEPKYTFQATEATRESFILRAGICGPTGCGKTKTGLIIGTRLVQKLKTGPLFVIDSENRSALRYAYSPRTRQGYKFKHVAMPADDYGPLAYMAALDYCEDQGAGVILVDSLSHVWNGINGVLEQVDRITDQSRSKAAFNTGWKDMTPLHNKLVQRLLESRAHLIFTLRAKMHYDIVENERGRKEPVKVGLAPIAREGISYEPDLFFMMTAPGNDLVVDKSRCDSLAPGEVFKKPGDDFADIIAGWVQDAEPATGARSLGEAIVIAVTEGIAAGEQKSTDGYTAARKKLTDWCKSAGISAERHEEAQAAFKARVASALGRTVKGEHPNATADDEHPRRGNGAPAGQA